MFDAIVVGTGGLGSAVLYHLARRGQRVLGIDRHTPPHEFGSSHGHTRIYRQAYYEAPAYVPLAIRALDLWRRLEGDAGVELFANTGALTIGPERGGLVAGVLRSAREHGIAHERLDADAARRRFPLFEPPGDAVAVFEPGAGVLFPERCIAVHLALAREHGAELHKSEEVLSVEWHGRVARVNTTVAAYEAKHVVLAAGAWTPQLAGLERALTVTRETVHWFVPSSAQAAASTCPVAMVDSGGGSPILYTIPDFGDGFKAGLHHTGPVADPLAPDDSELDASREVVANVLRRMAPGAAGAPRSSVGCYYTSTRDGHFAIGPLPATPGIILASACSGHGFKFASALGDAVGGLACGERPDLPYDLFDVARL